MTSDRQPPMRIAARRGPAAGDAARWTHHRDIYRKTRSALLEREPAADDAVELAKSAFERACACAALEEIDELCEALAEHAAAGTAALVRARFRQGVVILRWADGRTRELPPGEAPLVPAIWLNAACAACIVRDVDAQRTLCSQGSSHREPLCEAFAALVRNDPAAAQLARSAQSALAADPPQHLIVDPKRSLQLPLARLIERLAGGDTGNWSADVKVALEAFDRFYAPEDLAHFAPGFLPLGILALCAIAHDRGVRLDFESEYLPPRLIEGGCSQRAFSVEYEVRAAHARSAAEIRWWLDLAGVPRQERSHRLVDRDDQMVARYEFGGSAAPKASAEFAMDPSGPALLDADELRLVSDAHARSVDADGPSDATQRAYLEDAIAALDELRSRLTQDDERERLDAVREQYANLLAGPSEAESQIDPRAGSLVWSQLIGASLAELLARLPEAPDGVAVLRPRDEDYENVFAPAAVAGARAAYTSLWNAGVSVQAPAQASCDEHIYVAPAGMLASDNELSRPFPGGYRTIADRLDPHRVWVCWRYVVPGDKSGINYDGLVWCDDHWAWFPKPYRVLKQG